MGHHPESNCTTTDAHNRWTPATRYFVTDDEGIAVGLPPLLITGIVLQSSTVEAQPSGTIID